MRVGVFGAGAIGCYLGVKLSSVGVPVRLLARADVVADVDRLEAIGADGRVARAGADLEASEDPAVLADADVVLVTAKSSASEEAGRTLAAVLHPSALVITLQNGLFNAARLREGLGHRVVEGFVSFNVVREGPRTRRTSKGEVVMGAHSSCRAIARSLEEAGEDALVTGDVERLAEGKLCMNLNNGVCAATGLPIAASLRDRDARACLAACIAEGHRVLSRSGRRPKSPIGLPIRLVPPLLRLPNAIVLRVARQLVAVDPAARSSTLIDLDRGRATEIDELNGAIVTLAAELGERAPANAAVLAAVRAHEASVARGEAPGYLSPRELRARVGAAKE